MKLNKYTFRIKEDKSGRAINIVTSTAKSARLMAAALHRIPINELQLISGRTILK